MKVTTLKMVDASELFDLVKQKYPDSKAYNKFCELAENGSIRKFWTPDNEEEYEFREPWELEMFEVLKDEIGLKFGECVGIEIWW